jgi:hypothetical protein
MSKPIWFIVGLTVGVYIDQNYKIPSVKIIIETIVKHIKENEKK